MELRDFFVGGRFENWQYKMALEFPGEAAAAAQILGDLAVAEAPDHIPGPLTVQNLRQLLPEHVAQGDDAVAVQTAGHHRAVAEDAEVVLQAVAVNLFTLVRGILIRPGEAVAPLQKQAVPDPIAPGIFLPGLGKMQSQPLQHCVIFSVVAAIVPQSQRDENTGLAGFFGKKRHLVQVMQVLVQIAELKAVDRNVDLVQPGQQLVAQPGKQGAIGGQHGSEAGLPGHLDEARQQRMQQRLTHEMVVQVLGLSLQLMQDVGIFSLRQKPGWAAVAVAEGAVHIADVGDLHIDPGIHRRHFLVVFVIISADRRLGNPLWLWANPFSSCNAAGNNL